MLKSLRSWIDCANGDVIGLALIKGYSIFFESCWSRFGYCLGVYETFLLPNAETDMFLPVADVPALFSFVIDFADEP